MSDWAIIAIILVCAVAMFAFKRPTNQRVDWKAMRLFAKRPHWSRRGARTQIDQEITLHIDSFNILQNAQLNKFIRERDVHTVARVLEEDAGYPRAKAIDEAERVTGIEWK